MSKVKIRLCNKCNEETWHDIGKKQATTRSGSYTRRSTIRCRRCGTKEIVNKTKGKRTVAGKNEVGK